MSMTHTRTTSLFQGARAAALAMTLGLTLAGIARAGGFSPPTNFSAGDVPLSVAMGDLDGDGDLDLAVANSSSGTVSILLGAGDGGFAPQTIFPVGSVPQSVALGDLDGDGDLDLAVANKSSNNVSILLGAGDGSFAPQSTFPVGNDPSSVALGDIDGDGDLDLAVANFSGSVSILLNNGDGGFAPQTTFPAGTNSISVAMGDLDGDGDLDLAVANNFTLGNSVSILLGAGDGNFAPPTTVPVGGNPVFVALGDLNGDGDLDLATANRSHNVSILLGFGDGTFTIPTTYPVGINPLSVALGDLDGDGDLDLVTANLSDDNVSILRGAGHGGFLPQTTFPAGDGPVSVSMGDLDGDGDLDLAVANDFSNNVSILINMTNAIAPGAFDLLSPPDGSAGLSLPEAAEPWPGSPLHTAPVDWSVATGFDNTYTLTVALDPGLTNIVHQHAGIETHFDVPVGVLQSGTRYYWSVVAENPIGATPATSGAFTFTTASPADLNNDGVVNGADLAQLLVNWGVLP